jgi:exportin-2 (importin alpha re-exporter)
MFPPTERPSTAAAEVRSPTPFGPSQIIAQDTLQLEIRQQAAVQFKNYVKFRWAPRADAEGDVAQAIADAEKEQIKTHITDLMLSAPPRVRAQLSEALTIISGHDFPARWQGLLPQLLEKLKTEDSSSLNGVLSTADSIYHRYRGQFMTDQLNQELEYSQQFVGPLLAVTQRLTAACTAAAAAASSENLPQHLTNARLALSIFYSLNSPGLTEEFENTLNDWMDCLHALLSLSAPSVASRDPDTESPLDALKATACECLSLFMERNEEEFAPHLEKFATDVWQLLVSVGQDVGQDALAMAAIAFLTTVARSVHHTLFSDPAVLKQVCEGIVVPNLRLRDQDEELFEMNWVEYVRRDTEGSDSDTRRRAASELVRALVEKFPQQTTELFSTYVAALLAEASTAPETAWRAKDAAIFLVSALAVRGRTAAAGATVTNQLVNLQDFYVTHVKPELADADVESRPIIKADCLRFATTFRSQLPQEEALQLFPRATSLLASTHNVVHSYAAILIERLLALRRGGALAFTPAQLGPYLQPLLERLFGALRLPESGENEYVMRAVMRLVMFVGAAIAPVAAVALSSLAEVLLTVARNPRQPGFNHYLFESIAALVKFGCQGHTASIASYEAVLFPPLQIILQEDVQEFHPYAFQLFAQLVELRAGTSAGASLPETYLQLLPGLLSPIFWERPGNVPALGRLLRAYIAAVPSEIVSRSLLTGVLGVFQKLIASKAHDHEGMALLDALTVSMDPGVMSQYMTAIWTLLFQRLQVAQTPKISRCFLQSAALMAAKRGGAAVGDSMETVQSGITAMIVQSMWAPTLAGPGSPSEDRIATVGSARMLCEAPSLQSDAAASASGALLAALAQRAAVKEAANGHGLSSQAQEGEDGEGGAEEGFLGYSAAYAKLHNAAEAERDVLADVSDYRADVAGRLAAYAAQHPGRLQSLAHAAPAEAQSALQQLFQRANIVA